MDEIVEQVMKIIDEASHRCARERFLEKKQQKAAAEMPNATTAASLGTDSNE